MGFWSALGSAAKGIGKAALDEAKRQSDKINSEKDELRHADDSTLKLLAEHGSTPHERAAARMILRDRGYSNY